MTQTGNITFQKTNELLLICFLKCCHSLHFTATIHVIYRQIIEGQDIIKKKKSLFAKLFLFFIYLSCPVQLLLSPFKVT